MNISEVLSATLANDKDVRKNAEDQLETAAQTYFPEYIIALSSELRNDSAEDYIRSSAGLALKNALTSRDRARLDEFQKRWLDTDLEVKKKVKDNALASLLTPKHTVANQAAQVIASIAAIEIPRAEWPQLMTQLVQNVSDTTSTDALKQSSLTTIGYICEEDSPELRDSLSQHSNAILTAVVQGARKEEPNNDVRNAAMDALADSLEFVRTNFEIEGERNYIMQVVCEATQSEDARIQQAAFGCLNKIMALYYDKMRYYMEKALFGLTVVGMKHEEEDVAKLAIEFWCTVCEEEIQIEEDNVQLQQEGIRPDGLREFFNFARVAANEVVPVLLQLLTKQDEDASDDEYNVARAAYQCLQLYSQCVGGLVIPPVLAFVEANLRHDDWHMRDAAVSSFGAIMEGPDFKMLEPLIKQALPVLMSMMEDKSVTVKDSAAYALGRICECCGPAIDPLLHLPALIQALFVGLNDSPKMAASCCWALMSIADRFGAETAYNETNLLSKHFQQSVQTLLHVTEQYQANGELRTAAYEVLNSFVNNVALDEILAIGSLLIIILERLEKTIAMQNQVVSADDRNTLEEIQNSLCSVLMSIIQRLDKQVKPQSDRIMQTLLQILTTCPPKSSVPEGVFAAIGAVTNALEEDFNVYMEAFLPFLYNALASQDEPQLCSMAIGLVSDIVRSINEKAAPYCDQFMNYLLDDLRSVTLSQTFKPAILQCFGDIAQAIGGHFETYLSVVMQVLQQASQISAGDGDNIDLLEYVLSLREGIMDAYDGIILAMKGANKQNLLAAYVQPIFGFLSVVNLDPNKPEALLRSAMGVLGDLADAFPNGDFSAYFRSEWIAAMVKEVRGNRLYDHRTIDVARWAREQVRKQSSLPV